MKNHFIFPYAGNKRNEAENIAEKINFNNITTIIEPFCGSAAISYYISTQQPNKYNYILNDNDKTLIKIYNTLKDEEQTNLLNGKINLLIDKFNLYTDDTQRKLYYNSICNTDNIESYVFKYKYYNLRPGLYPQMNRLKEIKKIDLKIYPIYKFLQSENVEISNIDGLEFIKSKKDDINNLLILDPPYLACYNDFYNNSDINIYEYLNDNNINIFNCSIYLILENMWIVKLLFRTNKIIDTYNKIYEISKKRTSHIIITKLSTVN